MNKENECYAYFSVHGSFEPAEITRRVGVTPTNIWQKGDRNPRTDRLRNFSRWILRSRLETTAPLEAHAKDVLDQLDTNRAAFRETSVELEGTLQLVGYFFRDYPGLSFDHDFIARMAAYSLSMDFDFYFLQSERREDS